MTKGNISYGHHTDFWKSFPSSAMLRHDQQLKLERIRIGSREMVSLLCLSNQILWSNYFSRLVGFDSDSLNSCELLRDIEGVIVNLCKSKALLWYHLIRPD